MSIGDHKTVPKPSASAATLVSFGITTSGHDAAVQRATRRRISQLFCQEQKKSKIRQKRNIPAEGIFWGFSG
jgi:hypothetical protein